MTQTDYFPQNIVVLGLSGSTMGLSQILHRASSLLLLRLPPLLKEKVAGTLTVAKLYGEDRIRYLRYCAREFSERESTPLFDSKGYY